SASTAPLAARVAAVPGAREAVAALAALLPIAELAGGLAEAPKARALAESAGLGRKLREAMAEAGLDPGLADAASGFAMAMLGRLGRVSERLGGGPGGISGRATARVILADDEARALFRVNRWNNESWIDADRCGSARRCTPWRLWRSAGSAPPRRSARCPRPTGCSRARSGAWTAL
ncbi:MAG TPA: hypothetical protein PLW80_08460, partial [Spirochaetales bacterium]|nr:hypothetical protein [Spirochaetales bacterium]